MHPGASFILAAALIALPANGAAQDGFRFGADNLGAPMERPGFGVAGRAAAGDRPAPGAAGQGDYSAFLNRFSIVEPTEDIAGLWSVFAVTRHLCGALYRGEKSLVDRAPQGFVIARGDIHALGFGGRNWNRDWYAVTVTGDSETDAAGGHPFWEIRYDGDGRLVSCGVTIGPKPDPEDGSAGGDDRAREIQFLYIALPQLLSAILTEPRFAGIHPLSPHELITMAVPCGDDWCRVETIYDLRPGRWHVSSTFRFRLRTKPD